MTRPTGVTILAVLQMICALLGVMVSSVALFLRGILATGFWTILVMFGDSSSDAQVTGMALLMIILPIIALIVSILALFASFGLFILKGWAWTLTRVLQVISIIVNGVYVFMGENAGAAIFSIVISAVIIYYLHRRNVKLAFNKV
ncbi:MAG: hypothetical protein RID53_24490 [Coleofasciculus sp. B1-GNL1-01]|uniref:hypothetical protein n=1 Tax=Coleofasciculus sp. B1-GNL1-01 TaxID=3068484 RepID=UPI0033032D04